MGEYIGQTQVKVKEKLDEALGGVLFIDEAHRLNSGSGAAEAFKKEALGVLIAAMTNPVYRNNMLIVLAGYELEMDNLLATDPGLKRRVPKRVIFLDIEPEVAEIILNKKLASEGFRLCEECRGGVIQQFFKKLSTMPGWGNIGDVDSMVNFLFEALSVRMMGPNQHNEIDAFSARIASWDKVYTVEDVNTAIGNFLDTRVVKAASQPSNLYRSGDELFNTSSDSAARFPPPVMRTSMREECEEVEEEEEEEEERSVEEVQLTIPVDNFRRLALDSLNDAYQSIIGDASYLSFMLDGDAVGSEGWVRVREEVVEKLAPSVDKDIKCLQKEIECLMCESRQVLVNDSEQKNEIQKLQGLIDSDENDDSDVDKEGLVDALTKLKVLYDSEVEICGICFRANTATSGCGYGGNSPCPIRIPLHEHTSFQ